MNTCEGGGGYKAPPQWGDILNLREGGPVLVSSILTRGASPVRAERDEGRRGTAKVIPGHQPVWERLAIAP